MKESRDKTLWCPSPNQKKLGFPFMQLLLAWLLQQDSPLLVLAVRYFGLPCEAVKMKLASCIFFANDGRIRILRVKRLGDIHRLQTC